MEARAGEPRRGEWNLWIYCSAWRLERANEILAASEDSRDHLAAAVEALDGRTVEAVQVVGPAHDVTLSFDAALTLRTFAVHSGSTSTGCSGCPTGQVRTIGPGTAATMASGDA